MQTKQKKDCVLEEHACDTYILNAMYVLRLRDGVIS